MELAVKYLKALMVCVPNHDVRYYLCGINFRSENGNVSAYATDGHRISKWLITNDYKGEDFNFIFSKNAIKTVIASKQDTVTLQPKTQTIELECGVITETIDGKYPDVSRVLNKDTIKNEDGGCFLNTNYISDVIKISKLLCNKNTLVKYHQFNSSPDSTVLFTFAGVDNFIHGIMPVRFDESEHHAQAIVTKTL